MSENKECQWAREAHRQLLTALKERLNHVNLDQVEDGFWDDILELISRHFPAPPLPEEVKESKVCLRGMRFEDLEISECHSIRCICDYLESPPQAEKHEPTYAGSEGNERYALLAALAHAAYRTHDPTPEACSGCEAVAKFLNEKY